MLIGCGCNCNEPIISELPSGSVRSSVAGEFSLLESQSITPNEGYCGACYNLPAAWRVSPGRDWLIANDLVRFHDCREVFYTDTTLRAYGANALTIEAGKLLSGGLISGDTLRQQVCAVYHSDERAPYAEKIDFDGNVVAECQPVNAYPKWELVVWTPLSDTQSNTLTQFVLFYWWCQDFMFNRAAQVGYGFSWQVNAIWNDEPPLTPRFQNCVRCFGAQPFDVSWMVDVAYEHILSPPAGRTISVCPA